MEAKPYTSQERWNPLEEMLQNKWNKHISLEYAGAPNENIVQNHLNIESFNVF